MSASKPRSRVAQKGAVVVKRVPATVRTTKAKQRRTQPERSEETQQRILEAAAEVLRKKGYAGLRVAEVSKLAKVSRGGQMHHFPSKDALVIATSEYLFRRGNERSVARARTLKGQTQDPIEGIIQDSMEFFFGDEFAVALDLVLTSGKTRGLRDKIFSHARTYRLDIEQAWYEVLLERGLTSQQAETAMWLTISIVRGMSIRALWQSDHALFRRMLDQWKGILGEWLLKPSAGQLSKRSASANRGART